MYGKIWDNEDVHELGSVETEFPAIVFNDTLTSEATLSCKPTVSSLNDNKIDFRISFDESDDEDYTVIFDKNSFSYKIISAKDVKTDSKKDYEKVNMPSFWSPKPTVSIRRILGNGYGVSTSCTVLGPRERNIDEVGGMHIFWNSVPLTDLKNTSYPHQRYAVYNTLVNDEEGTSFTSIRRIHQEDTAYPCLHFTRYHEGFNTNTPYPESTIRRIQGLLYTKILEDIKRGPYSKKTLIRRIPHCSIQRIDAIPGSIIDNPKLSFSMAPDGSLFLLFDVHFDGTFLSPLRYENGIVYEWAVRKDNPLDLANVRATLREKTQSVVVYELFFKLPQCELDVGLKIIENDRDLDVLYEYAHDHGVIQVYITHGPQDLSSYYVENLCLYGSEDDVNSRRKSVPKDAGNMSVQELVSWAEDEAALGSLAEEETVMGSIAIDDDICVTGVVDKGKGLADKGKGLAKKGKGLVDKGKGIM
ncbi:hypothetical protein Tco_0298672 [Tanacetum coccineum]